MQVELSVAVSNDQAAAALLAEHKALLVRGALNADIVGRFGRAWDAGYDAHMADLEPLTGGARLRFQGAYFNEIHDRAGLPRYELLRELARSPVIEIAQSLFGTPSALAFWGNLVHPRVMLNKSDALPFHQDGGQGGGFYLRAWILLYPESVSDNAAGLQLLPVPGEQRLLARTDDAGARYPGLAVTASEVERVKSHQAPWTPIVRLGDVLLFRGDCLHATYFPKHIDTRRSAIEATFIPATDTALNQIDRDFCIFSAGSVRYPSEQTIEAWGDGPCRDGFVTL